MKSNSTLNNMIWKFGERISAQIVTLAVSIILARLLSPSDYGSIAIVNIFISLANVFVSDGLGSALIQKKNVDKLDYSSVLYFNIGFSIVLYSILYYLAPLVSRIYGEGYGALTPVLRVLGLKLILAAINSVQQAYVSREMIFKKFFWATLIGTVVSGFVGIIMAYSGYGIWSLVAQYLTNSIVDTVVLAISLKWKPGFSFSFERVKHFFRFGFGILATSLLTTFYTKIRGLLIGKIYTADDLAYYERASKFPDLFVTNINSSMSAVMFPRLSQIQDDKRKIKELMRRFIRLSSFILIPLLVGLAAVAEPLITILLTEKWLPCVPIMQLLCINHIFRPMHTANIQALKAIGRSDVTFRLEIVKKSVEIVSLLLVMRISVLAIVLNMVVMSTIFTAVNAYPVSKYIGYRYKEQLLDVIPSLLFGILMFFSVSFIGFFVHNNYVQIIVQVIVGAAVYTSLQYAFNKQDLKYLFHMIRKKHS